MITQQIWYNTTAFDVYSGELVFTDLTLYKCYECKAIVQDAQGHEAWHSQVKQELAFLKDESMRSKNEVSDAIAKAVQTRGEIEGERQAIEAILNTLRRTETP